MIHDQNMKFHTFIAPLDINGTTATDAELDTAGYHYLTVWIQTGNVAANMTALKIQDSDASASGEADITGLAFTSPTAAAGDNNEYVAFIDLRSRKRYISIVATAGAGATLISATGLLSNAEVSPIDITTRGVTQQLIV